MSIDFKNGARLFTYKVAYDSGNAPNPFNKISTLAICKPKIRSVAKVGDVILGLDCLQDENRIVYCMVVESVIPWSDYIVGCNTGEFNTHLQANLSKKLSKNKNRVPKNKQDHGDCIWKNSNGKHEPLVSDSGHDESCYKTDVTDGVNVLVGETFWYFGKGDFFDIRLPVELKKIIPGRGHKSNANEDSKKVFATFFNHQLDSENISLGKSGTPKLSPDAVLDTEYRKACFKEQKENEQYGEETTKIGACS